jgi:hypothetical protein
MIGAVAGTPGTLPTGWGIFVSPTGLTRTIVGSGTVNGINYIDVRFNGTPSSTNEITLYLSPATTATLAQAWTASTWLSLAGGSTSNIAGISLRNFELNSGAYVRETPTNYVSSISSGFVRRQNITTSFGASANQIQLALSMFATAAGTPIDLTLRIGLPQLEQGAFATSVIPTTGTSATRSADIATITTLGSSIRSLFAQVRGPASGTRGIIGLDDNSVSNRIELLTSGTDPKLLVTTGGSAVADLDGGTVTANVEARLAARFAADNYAISVGGGVEVVDATGALPAVDRIRIGALQAGSTFSGTIARLTAWDQVLPNLRGVSQ